MLQSTWSYKKNWENESLTVSLPDQKRPLFSYLMSKFFIILLRGILGAVWLVATIVTTAILSPFVIAAWISKKLDQREINKGKNSSFDEFDKDANQ